MTAILVLCLLACTLWVLSTLGRRSSGHPQHTVDGFHRALSALDPSPRRPARRR